MNDLEQLTDRALHALPALAAPDTLLPRVLSAVRQWSERPWYARAWFTWPLGWQVAALVALGAAAVNGISTLSTIHQATFGSAGAVLRAASEAGAVIRSALVVAGTIEGIYQTWIGPLALFAAGVTVALVTGCAVLGMALNHVLCERT